MHTFPSITQHVDVLEFWFWDAWGFLASLVLSSVTSGDRISQADSPRNRKEAEMSSTLAALPLATKAPDVQQAHRGWEGHVFQIEEK